MFLDYLKNVPKAFLTASDNLLCYLFNKRAKRGSLFVNWDITPKCNARCVFCDRWRVNGEELTTEKKIKIIRELGKSGVWFLSLCGGEPLLTKDLDLIIKEIKKQKMLINISTNGSLLKEKAKLLLDLKVDFITVSVQSHKPEIHDFLTRCPGLFKRVKEGVELIRKLRERNSPRLYGRLVLNNLTISDLKNFLNYWRGKFDEIFLQPVRNDPKILFKIPKGMGFSKRNIKKFENFHRLLREYKVNNLYNTMVPEYIFKKEKLKNDVKCFAGFFLTIDAKGNLYSCSAHYKKLGNLNKEKLIDLLNSEKMKRFRHTIRSGRNKCICWYSGSMLNVYLSKIFRYL